MNNLTKTLIDSGLSEKEAHIYISLLELEIATVFEIARYSGINRSSTYIVLESLKKKGMVGTSPDRKVVRYFASSPETLLHIVKTKAKHEEDVKNNLESIIPELKALHKDTRHRPKVKVYEGKAGLIASFEDTLNSKEKLMRVVSAPANLGSIIYNYIPEYTKKRLEIGLKMLGIHPHDKMHNKLIENGPKGFDVYVTIPEEKYKFPADMAIYGNNIGYMSNKDGGIAVNIESKEMADVMKNVFDMAWKEAERLNKTLKRDGN